MQSSVGSDSDQTVLYDVGHRVDHFSDGYIDDTESLSISKVGETMHK